MDFYHIRERSTKNGVTEIYPDFRIGRSKDLMIRGKQFYAIWDERSGLWSTDEYDVQRLVDEDLWAYREEAVKRINGTVIVKLMGDFESNSWRNFRNFLALLSDSSHQLDEKLTFANTVVHKTDYVSRRLPYSLEEGTTDAYNELMTTFYNEEELEKLEWAVGAVVAGDAKDLQKLVVLSGPPGSGKGTFINIVQSLFPGYHTTFEAKALVGANNSFATEVFRDNPLVAIQHDGDLSKIEDNAKLNSIVSHEDMVMNVKFKPSYTSRINAFLFMGTNKAVRISDAQSGIIRRLIDVAPTGDRIPEDRYNVLVAQTHFELGAIAHRALSTYRRLGKHHFASYRPIDMMMRTDVFFNYVESHFDVFKAQDGVSLKQAWSLYKVFCDEALVEFKLPIHRFREELKNYFLVFDTVKRVDGHQVRSYYSGFKVEKFTPEAVVEVSAIPLVLDSEVSIFDTMCASCPAQYASNNETPLTKWANVTTTLADLDTTRLHYVKVPLHHIVIDFDLRNEQGEKDPQLNLEAASLWPPTYAEYSKGGGGLHLHYLWDGDPSTLSAVYADGIEVKVFVGDSSLRRRLSRASTTPVATISSGLPIKEQKVINSDTMKNERSIRDLIERNLKKEIHAGTKSSIDFIHKILNDAYESGMPYDMTELRPRILTFALNSTNQSEYCLGLVSKMKFKSDESTEIVAPQPSTMDKLVFFDVEVFPNLFIVCWKKQGSDHVVHMINPTAVQIEELLGLKLVGFNCRRYDNHILYAASMGYNNEQLYTLSQKIIDNNPSAAFSEAYNISYTDIYDFSSKKQSLKKFEVELGLRHQELGLPWDQPVPEERWVEVAGYCENDVRATEGTFEARYQDFVARQILANLSGLTVNDTTQKHTARVIFGKERNPQKEFVYTDLSEMFPGYEYNFGKSTYRGEEVGEGGYVYSEPGFYTDVTLLDVASMHPTSLNELNAFGPYTKNFWALVEARLAIKNKEYDKAKKLLNGALAPYLGSEEDATALSYALKIVVNIVYGLTSAKFDNPFRDIRNKDNIVAKRGALFMIDLKHEVQARGFTVAHIKTDSIKIPNATPEIIQFVMDFGAKYGYVFEHEATYSKMALVNDAVYVAAKPKKLKDGSVEWDIDNNVPVLEWTAVGAQFARPYVFKTLFSHECIVFDDLCETKSVQTSLHLDMNEALPEGEHNRIFVGKVGTFVPILPGFGGGVLQREKDGEFHAATGSSGYRWMEADMVKTLGREESIDIGYFTALVDAAIANLSKFGDVEWLLANDGTGLRALDAQEGAA